MTSGIEYNFIYVDTVSVLRSMPLCCVYLFITPPIKVSVI